MKSRAKGTVRREGKEVGEGERGGGRGRRGRVKVTG